MQHDAVTIPPPGFDADILLADQYDRREDLRVQVKMAIRGRWHRKAVGGTTTACGHPLNGYATRSEQYGPTIADMCDEGCFHPFELSRIPTPPAGESPDPPAPMLASSRRSGPP